MRRYENRGLMIDPSLEESLRKIRDRVRSNTDDSQAEQLRMKGRLAPERDSFIAVAQCSLGVMINVRMLRPRLGGPYVFTRK